jgi:hypothetical protein
VSLADVYRSAWEKKFNLGPGWLANWWPGTAISLGQRGVIRDGQLQYSGYAADYGVQFNLDPATSPVSGTWDYSSSNDISVEIRTDATLPGWQWLGNASAGVAASFGKQESVYFSANGTSVERIANIDKLKDDLKASAEQHEMPIGQSVVIERQLTSQAMLLASGGGSGELKATVSADLQISPSAPGALASLAGHLDVKTQTGGTSKQDWPNGMVLAFRVVTLGKRGWWWWRHIVVQGILPVGPDDFETILTPDDYFVRFR